MDLDRTCGDREYEVVKLEAPPPIASQLPSQSVTADITAKCGDNPKAVKEVMSANLDV